MQRSESIAQLAAAMAKAQGSFLAVGKDHEAKINSTKGNFSYRYADLATAVASTRAALTANAIAVVQPVRLERGIVVVTTMLMHESGEWISEEMCWPVADTDNRSIGSGTTYARRHSFMAMCGLASTDDDDDGERGRGGSHDTAKAKARPAPVKAAPQPEGDDAPDGGDHGAPGPTPGQAGEIKKLLADLGVTTQRGAYIDSVLPGAQTVADFDKLLGLLAQRAAARKGADAPAGTSQEQRDAIDELQTALTLTTQGVYALAGLEGRTPGPMTYAEAETVIAALTTHKAKLDAKKAGPA